MSIDDFRKKAEENDRDETLDSIRSKANPTLIEFLDDAVYKEGIKRREARALAGPVVLKPFTLISIDASKNQSCWNLNCTTCGCRELMSMFSESIDKNRKPLNRYSHNNRVADQLKLLESLKDINIRELCIHSEFPDFLGHIGLLLSACQKAENKRQIISKSILKQMVDIYPENILLLKMINENNILTPRSLEKFESILIT